MSGVITIAAYLEAKDRQMVSDIGTADIRAAKKEGFIEGMGKGTDNFKKELAKSIREYAMRYDLCEEGVTEFCRENDIPLNIERDVEITITFTAKTFMDSDDLESLVDDFCREVTTVHFMERTLEDIGIEGENYSIRVEG